jgi:xylulokinase
VKTAGDDLFVGLDLGTSSLKGVAVTAGGEVVARGHAAYRTVREAAGQAEQDPAAWLRAVRRVVRQLRAAAPPTRWRAIGLSAMIPTLVTVDRAGAPTGPAVTWEDARAEEQGEIYRGRAAGGAPGAGASRDSVSLYERTGQWVDGRYLLPMWMRLRTIKGERAAGTDRLLSAKDHLYWWLTGEFATDPSTASGFGCYDLARGRWMAAAAEAGGVIATDDAEGSAGTPGVPGLPAVLPSVTLRPLAAVAATHLGLPAGLPICLGAADSVLGMLALGVDAPGDVACITGTSSVIAGVSEDLLVDPRHRYLVTPLARSARWGLEMDLLSTGSAVRWMSRLLRLGVHGEARLMELAASAPPEADGVRVLPFLGGGEQGALWDPDLRGTVLDLSLAHNPAALARGLVDGIVFESCRCLDVLEQNGLPRSSIRIAGAGASAAFFRRRLADASGRSVLFARDPERPFSALGAARVAAGAIGCPPAEDSAWSGPLELTVPDSTQRDEWERRWTEYRNAVECVQRLYSRR